MHRGTVYNAMNMLIKKGLVGIINREDGVHLYSAKEDALFGIRKEEAFKMISKNPSKFFGEILKKEAYSYRNEIESQRCNG